jgi:hypothetical protein
MFMINSQKVPTRKAKHRPFVTVDLAGRLRQGVNTAEFDTCGRMIHRPALIPVLVGTAVGTGASLLADHLYEHLYPGTETRIRTGKDVVVDDPLADEDASDGRASA